MIDNSHLCGYCNGDGLDAGQEMCKACKATGIDPKFWSQEILRMKEEIYKLTTASSKSSYLPFDER